MYKGNTVSFILNGEIKEGKILDTKEGVDLNHTGTLYLIKYSFWRRATWFKWWFVLG